MNLGEMYEKVRPFVKDPGFEKIEARNSEIGRRVDELHSLIKQTLVSHQVERLVCELVEICQEEYKEPIIFGD
jgi:dihydropteroate synthase